jgi:hypothetical protein
MPSETIRFYFILWLGFGQEQCVKQFNLPHHPLMQKQALCHIANRVAAEEILLSGRREKWRRQVYVSNELPRTSEGSY